MYFKKIESEDSCRFLRLIFYNIFYLLLIQIEQQDINNNPINENKIIKINSNDSYEFRGAQQPSD